MEILPADAYFVTVVTRDRLPLLLCGEIPEYVEEALEHISGIDLDVFGYVLMPDHIHFMVRTSPRHLNRAIASFKRYTGRRISEEVCLPRPWQKRFWLICMAGAKMVDQRADYMLENPLRAGLVADLGDWPYSYWGTRWIRD